MNGMDDTQHAEAVEATQAEIGEAVQNLIVADPYRQESVAIGRIATEWGWDVNEVAAAFRAWKWGS